MFIFCKNMIFLFIFYFFDFYILTGNFISLSIYSKDTISSWIYWHQTYCISHSHNALGSRYLTSLEKLRNKAEVKKKRSPALTVLIFLLFSFDVPTVEISADAQMPTAAYLGCVIQVFKNEF